MTIIAPSREIQPTLDKLTSLPSDLGEVNPLLADSGYFSDGNVEACDKSDMTPYISLCRDKHNTPLDERFADPGPCPEDADAVTAMVHRLKTAEGKALNAKRTSTVETVFGIIKQVLGFRQFHLRGLNGARGEWNLVCMAWNLKRLHALAS